MGPAGVVVTIADWMLDPVVCAAMPKGTPRVDLATLVELKRLLMCTADTTHSWGDSGIVREDHHDASQAASTIASRQMNLMFDAKRSEGMSSAERDKVVLIVAQILMQAAGLNVEELEDDKL